MRADRYYLQVAIDVIDEKKALELATAAYRGGADIIEVGTPLIKSCGVGIVEKIAKICPGRTIFADMKTADAGEIEVELAKRAGASMVSVLAATDDEVIQETVKKAHEFGVKVICDLIGCKQPLERAREVDALDIDYIGFHVGISRQSKGVDAASLIEELRKVVNATKARIAVAGGIKLNQVRMLMESGAEIIIVGGAITKAENPEKVTEEFSKIIHG
ncbi:MAG: orotidine 5'-phosphate decarboxylase / HUMPS family protein [Candidatus Korarchaeota archaeon]